VLPEGRHETTPVDVTSRTATRSRVDATGRAGAQQLDYGGMDAVFDDTCGNPVNLHQD